MDRIVTRRDPLRARLQTRVTAEQDALEILTAQNQRPRTPGEVWIHSDALVWIDSGGNPRTTFIRLIDATHLSVSDALPGFRLSPFD